MSMFSIFGNKSKSSQSDSEIVEPIEIVKPNEIFNHFEQLNSHARDVHPGDDNNVNILNAAKQALGQLSDVSGMRNELGETVLHAICRIDQKEDLLAMSLSKGAGACLGVQREKDKETPMHIIFRNQDWETLELVAPFVNNDCLQCANKDQKTPMSLIENDQEALTQLHQAIKFEKLCPFLIQWVKAMVVEPVDLIHKQNKELSEEVEAARKRHDALFKEKMDLISASKKFSREVSRTRRQKNTHSTQPLHLRRSVPHLSMEFSDEFDTASLDDASHDRLRRISSDSMSEDDFPEQAFDYILNSKLNELEEELQQYNNPNVRETPEMGYSASGKFLRRTALHFAIENRMTQSACLLIAYGADVHAKDEEEKTPSDYYRKHKVNDADLAKYLLRPTRYLILRDKIKSGKGSSALKHLKVHAGNLDEVDKKDTDELTLLHLAILSKLHRVVRQLLKMGADVNLAAKKGATPLDFVLSLEGQNEKSVRKIREILIEYGAKNGTKKVPSMRQSAKKFQFVMEGLRSSGTYQTRPGSHSTGKRAVSPRRRKLVPKSGTFLSASAEKEHLNRSSTGMVSSDLTSHPVAPSRDENEKRQVVPSKTGTLVVQEERPTSGLQKSVSAKSYRSLYLKAKASDALASIPEGDPADASRSHLQRTMRNVESESVTHIASPALNRKSFRRRRSTSSRLAQTTIPPRTEQVDKPSRKGSRGSKHRKPSTQEASTRETSSSSDSPQQTAQRMTLCLADVQKEFDIDSAKQSPLRRRTIETDSPITSPRPAPLDDSEVIPTDKPLNVSDRVSRSSGPTSGTSSEALSVLKGKLSQSQRVTKIKSEK